MLKHIAVAVMAFVATLTAAVPTQAQYHRREPNWLARQLDEAHTVVPEIWDAHDRATAQSRWREHQRAYEGDYGIIPRPTGRLGPYIMGRRFPWDDCRYTWNSRDACRTHNDVQLAQFIDEAGGAQAVTYTAVEIAKLRAELERARQRETDTESSGEQRRTRFERYKAVNQMGECIRVNGSELKPQGPESKVDVYGTRLSISLKENSPCKTGVATELDEEHKLIFISCR